MDIEKLISTIERRPGMFVANKKLDYINYFINGFYYHGSMSETVTPIDYYFTDTFHSWVGKWILDNLNKDIDLGQGWYEYITSSTKDNEEAVSLFFKLAKLFFKEYHETINDS